MPSGHTDKLRTWGPVYRCSKRVWTGSKYVVENNNLEAIAENIQFVNEIHVDKWNCDNFEMIETLIEKEKEVLVINIY